MDDVDLYLEFFPPDRPPMSAREMDREIEDRLAAYWATHDPATELQQTVTTAVVQAHEAAEPWGKKSDQGPIEAPSRRLKERP